MLKKKTPKRDLPLEVGRTYDTKIYGAGLFTVERIAMNKQGEQMTAWGTYENAKHLGVCPLGVDRIVHEHVDGDTIEVCEHCGMQ